MKTSSPLERKIFLGSPFFLAKPKNFKGIGGAAATGGGCQILGSFGPTVPGANGVGITGSGCDTKMFLPEPSYLICSADANCARLRVGSRLCGRRSFFAEAESELRRSAECGFLATAASGPPVVLAGVVEAMVDEEGMNW